MLRVCYAYLMVKHHRGHQPGIGTPVDPPTGAQQCVTAGSGESPYRFWVRSMSDRFGPTRAAARGAPGAVLAALSAQPAKVNLCSFFDAVCASIRLFSELNSYKNNSNFCSLIHHCFFAAGSQKLHGALRVAAAGDRQWHHSLAWKPTAHAGTVAGPSIGDGLRWRYFAGRAATVKIRGNATESP